MIKQSAFHCNLGIVAGIVYLIIPISATVIFILFSAWLYTEKKRFEWKLFSFENKKI